MTFRAHAAVRQDLRNGVFRGRTLFEFVRAAERLDVVERMVIADVLQRIRNALNQVFLLDDCHGLNVWGRGVIGTVYGALRSAHGWFSAAGLRLLVRLRGRDGRFVEMFRMR